MKLLYISWQSNLVADLSFNPAYVWPPRLNQSAKHDSAE